MENGQNNVQKQQIQIIARNDRHEQDVKILKSNLNSTQEKQLELASKIRDHGHGNKQQIDNLAFQVTKSKNDFKLIEQQLKTVQQQQIQLTNLGRDNEQKINATWTIIWTNITNDINRLTDKQREMTNITGDISDINLRLQEAENQEKLLSERIDGQYKKVAVLWINFLDSKNLTQPILQKYGRSYAESIGVWSLSQNKTDAIRHEIEQINPNQINETEYKRIVTDRIPDTFSVKLHPIDSNLKKVKFY